MRQLVGGLAVIVAIQYLLIATFVVPKLSAFAQSAPRYLTGAKWGAIAFFVGCAATHVGIASEMLVGDHAATSSTSHLTSHLAAHLAQVIGGAFFIAIAYRRLVVSVIPREVSRRLHDAEDRLKLALDASGLGTWELDLATRELVAQFRMSGRSADDPDDPDDGVGTVSEPTTATWSMEQIVERVHPDDRPQVDEQVVRALATGRLDLEVRMTTGPGQPIRWIAATGQLYRDRAGTPTRVVGTVADTTEHRKSQLERVALERQLQHAQRLDAIGRLAGGVAHDFNNLLQVINGYVELVQLGNGDSPRSSRELDAIADAGRRGAALTKQLLAFSRDATGEAVSVDINEAVQGAVTLIQRLIGDDIRVVVSLTDDAGHVVIDPHQIGQVIMNLGLNARDAMPDGGLLTIETVPVDLDEHAAQAADGMGPGRYTVVAVSDTGVGMTPEVRDRLFEPFFTTKPNDAGTGLGLPIVHGIVQRAGGHVTAYSEPGEGAVFKVYLPRHDLSPNAVEPASPGYVVGDARVLVVEDEPGVRVLLETMLGRLGYAVTSVSGPEEAIALDDLDQHLLVTDVMMPSMTGPELASRLRRRRPDLKVLFISGYTGVAMTERSILTHDDAFMAKPFTMSALAERVGSLVGAPHPSDTTSHLRR